MKLAKNVQLMLKTSCQKVALLRALLRDSFSESARPLLPLHPRAKMQRPGVEPGSGMWLNLHLPSRALFKPLASDEGFELSGSSSFYHTRHSTRPPMHCLLVLFCFHSIKGSKKASAGVSFPCCKAAVPFPALRKREKGSNPRAR